MQGCNECVEGKTKINDWQRGAQTYTHKHARALMKAHKQLLQHQFTAMQRLNVCKLSRSTNYAAHIEGILGLLAHKLTNWRLSGERKSDFKLREASLERAAVSSSSVCAHR